MHKNVKSAHYQKSSVSWGLRMAGVKIKGKDEKVTEMVNILVILIALMVSHLFLFQNLLNPTLYKGDSEVHCMS